MSDATTYYRSFITHIDSLIKLLDQLRTDQDRMTQEPTLAADAAQAAQKSGRTDLTETDFTNAGNAIGQIIFAYDSGAPPQKSFLYTML